MALFVHLASAKHYHHIKRSGLKTSHTWLKFTGVFAMPVLPNHLVTHQWMRELRKWRSGPLIGVYFRLADDDTVYVGRYNQEHQKLTAAEAVAKLRTTDDETALGYEIIIPHAIPPAAIHRIRALPKPIGWRHCPGSHGQKPCGCSWCVYGNYNAQKLRDAYQREEDRWQQEQQARSQTAGNPPTADA